MRPLLAALTFAVLLSSCSSRHQDLALERQTPSPCIAGKVESAPNRYTVDIWVRWSGVETHQWDQAALDRADFPSCT